MEYIEYANVVDKSEWARGPWDSEPDKVQWQDKDTGLPCIALRNGSGVWCGYVGVAPGHPLYGCGYDCCPKACSDDWCNHRPDMFLNVHGGITFANSCTESDLAAFDRFRLHFKSETSKEAQAVPRGDTARWIKEWAPFADSFDDWRLRRHATTICHIPGHGEPDDVWWFGFDCAHSQDYCPAFEQYHMKGSHHDNDVYRTLDYAKGQCAELAKQLKVLQ